VLFRSIKYEKLNSISLNTNRPISQTIEIKDAKKIKEFIDCIDKDFREQTFEDMVSLKRGFAYADINFAYKDDNSGSPDRLIENSISYNITKNHKYTIQWLEENGYAEQLKFSANEIQYIEFYHQVNESASAGYPEAVKEYSTVNPLPDGEGKSLRITDPQTIQTILDTCETQNINYDDYYYGIIVYKNGFEDMDISDPRTKEMYEKYGSEYPTYQIYFNEGNIPAFLTDYFQ
jgi:hypothetical protein